MLNRITSSVSRIFGGLNLNKKPKATIITKDSENSGDSRCNRKSHSIEQQKIKDQYLDFITRISKVHYCFENENDHQLIDAIIVGDMKKVTTDLNDGIDPDMVDTNEDVTLLVQACGSRTLEIAELLLMRGASVEHPARSGDRPIHVAIDLIEGETLKDPLRTALIKLLISNKADVNARTIEGGSPLTIAAHNRDSNTVRLLLEHQADPNAVTNEGKTALDFAMRCDEDFPTHCLETNRLLQDAMRSQRPSFGRMRC